LTFALSIARTSRPPKAPAPELDAEALDHIRRFFAWDLSFGGWSL
jgi:hypothetical protein